MLRKFLSATTVAAFGAVLMVGCSDPKGTVSDVSVQVPVVPVAGTTSSSVSESSVTVNWTYSTTEVVTGFQVYRKNTDGTQSLLSTVSASARSYTAQDLTAGQTYTFVIVPVRNGAQGSPIEIAASTKALFADGNRSAQPPFVKDLASGLSAISIIGSDDVLAQSPNFVFGGSSDGLGFYKNADGTYTMVTNHEDNYAVSRVILDKNLKPVKGEYLLSSTEGKFRLCSASLATPAEHGFGPLFITCGESGPESQTHAVNPDATAVPVTNTLKPALGYWSAENAVPMHKDAFPGKTVILIGDDDSNNSSTAASGATGFGQFAVYIGNTGDLDNGELFVMTRNDGKTTEMDMLPGSTVPVTMKKVNFNASTPFATFRDAVNALAPIGFGRVEDIDYRKGSAANYREVYFNVTGQNNTGGNADYQRTKYGRTYKLNLPADFLTSKTATIEVVLDGDSKTASGAAAARTKGAFTAPAATSFTNVDNICVTDNYLYTQEDSNGYGDEQHDASIYQYNLTTKEVKVMFELNHYRGATLPTVKGTISSGSNGSWEYGAMIDVSETIGVPNSFLVCVQTHGWRGTPYVNPDKGTIRTAEDQASQIILVRGIQK